MNETVVDTCVHHRWGADPEILEYVEPSWRRWLGEPGSIPMGGLRPFLPTMYSNPRGDTLAGEESADGRPAASSPEQLAERLLSDARVSRVLLMHERMMLAPALPNPHLALAITRAANDWTIDRWLSRDDRLHGVVLIPSQVPSEAAAEIRRVGKHPQMVAVMQTANGLGKLFGHPVYRPIYEAAAELDLPIVVHRGGDAITDTTAMPVAGGHPFTFAEHAALQAEALFSHVTSFISSGVFREFSNLRVFIAGGGITWIPGLIYRMELAWRTKRYETPWLRDPRRDFYERIRVSTYGLERQSPIVRRMTESFPEFERLLCYGSGYPAWDTDMPEAICDSFPEPWHARILRENADEWFRWPGSARSAAHADGVPQEVGR